MAQAQAINPEGVGNLKRTHPASLLLFQAGDHAAGAGASVITYTKDPNAKTVIGWIHCSYASAPTAGSIQIEDGSGTVVFKQLLSTAGPHTFNFPIPKAGSTNKDLIVTLADGGVASCLDVGAWREP